MISPHKGGVTKPPENQITCDDETADVTKIPNPTNTYNLFYTLLSHLISWQRQLHPRCQWRVGHTPDRVTEIVAREGEVRHFPEGGGGNYVQDPEGGTASLACKGDTTK